MNLAIFFSFLVFETFNSARETTEMLRSSSTLRPSAPKTCRWSFGRAGAQLRLNLFHFPSPAPLTHPSPLLHPIRPSGCLRRVEVGDRKGEQDLELAQTLFPTFSPGNHQLSNYAGNVLSYPKEITSSATK